MDKTKQDNPIKRCVNIDWLEVYCLESRFNYPCDADYFRRMGYSVKERDYGTRQYNQMFTICDKWDNPMIEIRRDPPSGGSEFNGLTQDSTHIRLVNAYCYYNNPIGLLREFLMRHDYVFKRIFRIDVCYDFEYFDSGDLPERFVKRFLECKYRKINQCHLTAHGQDNWNGYDWETLSWGSPASMVSTKLYDKTHELRAAANDKPYIRQAWFECGLVDDPMKMVKIGKDGQPYTPKIWRVEFSMKSSADRWVIIEDQSGKREKKKAVPHTMALFEGRERLWERFEELAYHYFRFKYFEPDKRKDRCKDKVLFHFNQNREFYQLEQIAPASKPNHDEAVLRRRLEMYKMKCFDARIREACDVILKQLQGRELARLCSNPASDEINALRQAIAYRMKWKDEDAAVVINRIQKALKEGSIF